MAAPMAELVSVDIRTITPALPVEAITAPLPPAAFHLALPTPAPYTIPLPDMAILRTAPARSTIICQPPAPLICSVMDAYLVGPYGFVVLPDKRVIAEQQADYKLHVLHNFKFRKMLVDAGARPQTFTQPVFRATKHHAANYGHCLIESIAMIPTANQVQLPADTQKLYFDYGLSFIGEMYRLAGWSGMTESAGVQVHAPQILFVLQEHSPELFDWVRTALTAGAVPGKGRYYIPRSVTDGRHIDNQAAIDPVLTKYNIRTLTPQKLAVAAQANLFAGAELVIGPSGAGLCNGIYMRPGGLMVELVNSDTAHRDWFRRYAALSGLRYAVLEGKELNRPPKSGSAQNIDFEIDPAELDALLGLVL